MCFMVEIISRSCNGYTAKAEGKLRMKRLRLINDGNETWTVESNTSQFRKGSTAFNKRRIMV